MFTNTEAPFFGWSQCFKAGFTLMWIGCRFPSIQFEWEEIVTSPLWSRFIYLRGGCGATCTGVLCAFGSISRPNSGNNLSIYSIYHICQCIKRPGIWKRPLNITGVFFVFFARTHRIRRPPFRCFLFLSSGAIFFFLFAGAGANHGKRCILLMNTKPAWIGRGCNIISPRLSDSQSQSEQALGLAEVVTLIQASSVFIWMSLTRIG